MYFAFVQCVLDIRFPDEHFKCFLVQLGGMHYLSHKSSTALK